VVLIMFGSLNKRGVTSLEFQVLPFADASSPVWYLGIFGVLQYDNLFSLLIDDTAGDNDANNEYYLDNASKRASHSRK
jgi:hypothetical protein